MLRSLALLFLCLSAVSFGQPPDAPLPPPLEPTPAAAPVAPVQPRGIFVGENWRYQHHSAWGGLGLRILADLVAIPSGIVNWDAQDATIAAVTVASTVTFSLPLGPSIDVRLQRSLQNSLGDNHLMLWTKYGDMLIWLSVWSAIGSTLFYGLASGNNAYVETAVLAFEAFWVSQIYTNVIKALTGREGPNDGTGEGTFHGPSAYTRLFPAGTPSGHMASMYAMLSVVMYYWNEPILWIGLNMVAIIAGVTMVADNYHYTSEIILGAAIGFFTGRWVVQHRSSRFHYGADGLVERIRVSPFIVPGGGYGLGASVAF